MPSLWQDLRLAVRFLWSTPGFTIPAILTLALGIGANGTMFTLADAVLLRPLPIADADRIVHIFQDRADRPPQPYPLSFADYLDYREGSRSFEALAAHYATSPMHVIFAGESATVTGAVATSSYFDVLRLQPAIGRFFTKEEDSVRDRDAVAVVSHGFWQRQTGGDATAVGRSIQINGTSFTIVGVAPRGFSGVHPRGNETEVWIPSAMFRVGYRYCDGFARGCTIVQLLGRLRPGISIEHAQAELDVIARRLEASYPSTNKGTGVRIVAARGLGLGPQREETRQVSLFLGVVAVVLLIACANVAGLLLTRAAGRRKEIATRLALGATRGRLARQLFTESLVIALLGCCAGLLFAAWGNVVLEAVYAHDGAGRPVAFHLTMRGTVLAAMAAVSGLSAVIFGLLPALRAGGTDVIAVLKSEGGSGGVQRSRLRQALVVGQVALSIMLLVGAGLLLGSVRHLYRGPGYDPGSLVMLRLRPSLVDYPRTRAHAYQRAVIRRLESIPGVVSASPMVYLTLIGAGIQVEVSSPDGQQGHRFDAVAGHGGAGHFRTLGLTLLDGRDFTERDDSRAPAVTIVNDVLATRVWPGARAVGQTLVLDGVPHTVIGVVPDAQYYAAGESPRPQVFFSYWQPRSDDAFLNDSRVIVKVAGDPVGMMPAIRRAVAEVDPSVPISEDYPLRDRVKYSYQPVRFAATLIASFAGLALALSAVGLYGVLSFSVAQRTREIGIRVALGARRSDITGLVLRDGLVMTLVGASLGVAGAWAASRAVSALLYGVRADDPLAFGIAVAVLAATAFVACVPPASRAARIPAWSALRYD